MKRQFCSIYKISLRIIAILLILVSFGCKRLDLNVKTPVLDRSLPDETSYKVRIVEYVGPGKSYILEAKKIERFYDRKILNAWDVRITTYDKFNKLQSTIYADTTIVDDARNLIYANGKVRINSTNGNIQARRIVWNRNVDQIVAPDKVVLSRGETTLRGTNLRTDSKVSYAEMDVVSAEGRVSDQDIDW